MNWQDLSPGRLFTSAKGWAPSTAWTNNNFTTWLGRGRPAVGGGATSDAGATSSPAQPTITDDNQWQAPSSISLGDARSNWINPHVASPNTTVGGSSISGGEQSHAPASKHFSEMEMSSGSAFTPPPGGSNL